LPLHVLFPLNTTPTTNNYTLSLHDALPISTEKCTKAYESIISEENAASASGESSNSGTRWGGACPGWYINREPFLDVIRMHRARSEEHTSELQSLRHLVCRLLLEKKKKKRL